MKRTGFTLAEILVVLVVIGIVSAAVAPVLVRGDRPHPAGSAANQVRDLLATARRTAVRRGEAVVLELDTRTGRYSMVSCAERASGEGCLAQGELVLPPQVAYDPPAGRRRFVFDPVGAGAGPALTLRGEGRSASVEIDPWTGEIRARTR